MLSGTVFCCPKAPPVPPDELDTIRSTINVLRGELAEANDPGDFAIPVRELAEAVRVLAGSGRECLSFAPGGTPRDLDTIWCLLVDQERLLRRRLLHAPESHRALPVALEHVSRAVNAMPGAFYRRRRSARA